MLNKIN